MKIIKALSLGLGLAIACFVLLLLMAPPLMPSNYHALIQVDGSTIAIQCKKPLFLGSHIYFEIPSTLQTRFRWFMVNLDKQTVSVPLPVYSGPLGIQYIHRDQSHGIGLKDKKMESDWSVTFDQNGVSFTDGSLSVFVAKKPA